jgi:3-oxoacyl-[acyl-carrier protein] reductase
MNLAIDGLTVLITGASGGIGRAVGALAAAEGAQVALCARQNAAALEQWTGEQPWRERALLLSGDVADPDDCERMFGQTVERFGRVDACVLSAGVWPPDDARLDQLPPERIRRTLEVNLHGSLWSARSFLAALARSGPRADGRGASVVFIGSTAGRFGERGHVDYAASKAGLHGLVRTLKNEIVDLDPYGRVNMVEPGWTRTPMTEAQLGRPGTIRAALGTTPVRQIASAGDIARATCFLLSPAAARHVTGEILTVSGGMEGRVRWQPEEIDEAAVRERG